MSGSTSVAVTHCQNCQACPLSNQQNTPYNCHDITSLQLHSFQQLQQYKESKTFCQIEVTLFASQWYVRSLSQPFSGFSYLQSPFIVPCSSPPSIHTPPLNLQLTAPQSSPPPSSPPLTPSAGTTARPSSPPGGAKTVIRRKAAADRADKVANARPTSTRAAGAGGSSSTMLRTYLIFNGSGG